jgi:plasmid stabilization system protein ParE
MKICWTPEARISYYNILDHLHKNWGKKEIQRFVDQTDSILRLIQKNPAMFKRSQKKNIHIGLISKHTSLFYRVTPKEIHLLTFWDNRRDPALKKY